MKSELNYAGIFGLLVVLGLVIWAINVFPTDVKEKVTNVISFPSTYYRTTCFVQEVFDDGTLSYTRVYETSHYPVVVDHKADRIRIRLDDGETILYNGPYLIEEIKTEQN